MTRDTPFHRWLAAVLSRIALELAQRLLLELPPPDSTLAEPPPTPLAQQVWRLGRWLDAAASPLPADVPGTAIPLDRLFERYLADALADAGCEIAAQPTLALRADGGDVLRLRPDLVASRNGRPTAVLDAKWKSFARAPDPADAHQLLAYCHLLGVRRGALVYPCRRHRHRCLHFDGGTLDLFAVRVTGDAVKCRRSLARLAAWLASPLA